MKNKNITLGLLAVTFGTAFATTDIGDDRWGGYVKLKYFQEEEITCNRMGDCIGGPFTCRVSVNGLYYELNSEDCILPGKRSSSSDPIAVIGDSEIECVIEDY